MPKIVDHVQRRREIVWALWQVIHERGIDGVTFQAVATAGGVSVGRIQHYFDSKEQLIRAGAEQMVVEAESAYRDGEKLGDPRSELEALLVQPVPTAEPGRMGVAVWYAYLAKSASDPWVRNFLESTSRGTVGEAARLLVKLHVKETESLKEASRLVAFGNGITQSVLIGVLVPEAGAAAIAAEIDLVVHRMAVDAPKFTRTDL